MILAQCVLQSLSYIVCHSVALFSFSLADVWTVSNGWQSLFPCIPFDWALGKACKVYKSYSGFFDGCSEVLNDISEIIQRMTC